MAIEDEAGQVAAAADKSVTREAIADLADRVATLVGTYAVYLAAQPDAAFPGDTRAKLVMQAGANAWHAFLCHGQQCGDGVVIEGDE